jgi:hypothetical protein
MSVVQRCPSCGTTKATGGECEACHDADVRYFCTNHTPGLWLDASTCSSCGARFGERARRDSAPAAPVITKRKRHGAPSFAGPRPARPAAARADRAGTYREVRTDRRPAPSRHEDARAPRDSRMALWQQLLQAAVRARYMPSSTARYRMEPRIRRRTGGCLKSLLLSLVLLLLALGSVVFVFGRALLGV